MHLRRVVCAGRLSGKEQAAIDVGRDFVVVHGSGAAGGHGGVAAEGPGVLAPASDDAADGVRHVAAGVILAEPLHDALQDLDIGHALEIDRRLPRHQGTDHVSACTAGCG